MSYGHDRTVIPVQIASGTALSAEVNVGGKTIVGIQMPAGWDTAGISFAALIREPSALPKVPVFGKVQDSAGTEVVVLTPALDTYVSIAPSAATRALGRIKVRSGVAATPVNQTATRDFFLVCDDS